MRSAPTLPSPIAEEEWQLRLDLAACYRAFVHFGWTDLIFTHLSARVPGIPDQYLINPYGLLFQEITASSLIRVDFQGNVVSGEYPFNDAGHAIHTSVLAARPDINVVLHSHTRAGMAVSCMPCGVLPISQQANEILDLVSYHEYDVATDNPVECDRLASDLGHKYLMVMHNHGLLSAGRSVGEAFYHLYTLENACKVQVDVMASGMEPLVPQDSARQRLREDGKPDPAGPSVTAHRAWSAVRRMIEKSNPDINR